ncbi:hypothetical protein AMTRI_Chr11g156190 [Amborella trichopoda]
MAIHPSIVIQQQERKTGFTEREKLKPLAENEIAAAKQLVQLSDDGKAEKNRWGLNSSSPPLSYSVDGGAVVEGKKPSAILKPKRRFRSLSSIYTKTRPVDDMRKKFKCREQNMLHIDEAFIDDINRHLQCRAAPLASPAGGNQTSRTHEVQGIRCSTNHLAYGD